MLGQAGGTGALQQDISKKQRMEIVTEHSLTMKQNRRVHRIGKLLRFITPHEVLCDLLNHFVLYV